MIANVKYYWSECTKLALQPAGVLAATYALIAFLASVGADYYKVSRHEYDKRMADRVLVFIDTTREFDALVPALAHTLMDKANADAARQKLHVNLNRQYSEVRDLAPLLRENQVIAKEYTDSLINLDREISQTPAILEMKRFWESVAKVVEARRPLTAELRRRVSLDIK
jgi:hypothetical protein